LKQSAKQRRALSSNDFAIPPQGARRGKYPIPDQEHAIAALARVDADGSSEEKRKVRAAVRKRYPNLASSQGDPRSDTGRASARDDAGRASTRDDAGRASTRDDAGADISVPAPRQESDAAHAKHKAGRR
jgi:hypothetical protein